MHIVLEDPREKFAPGAIVDGAQEHPLRARGVAMIPVAPELMPAPTHVVRQRRNAVLGFFRRDFGTGWPLSAQAALMAPMLMYAVPGFTRVHWRARLQARVDVEKLQGFAGALRICPDMTQSGASGLSISVTEKAVTPLTLKALGEPDAKHGWYVGGEAVLNATTEGYVGLGLWGHCLGGELAVVWSAVSMTR